MSTHNICFLEELRKILCGLELCVYQKPLLYSVALLTDSDLYCLHIPCVSYIFIVNLRNSEWLLSM